MKRTWNKMKISRQSEAEFPEFDSDENARKFAKSKYGDGYGMANCEMIYDQEVYFYHLILDRKNYFDSVKKLEEDGFIMDSLDFMNSYQPIEIWGDGRIHIIH